jgi:uncharacterized protein (DUF1330 family)
MAAYVIAEIAVLDAEGYESYKPLAEASITAHGGRYCVRGGEVVSLEGAPSRAGSSCSSSLILQLPVLGTTQGTTKRH